MVTVFPLISARALIKYFKKLHGRLLDGGAYLKLPKMS